MEEKKYEAGRVEISSAEYRDLVTEAVKSSEEASRVRSEKWKLEDEKRKLEEQLAIAHKEIAALSERVEAMTGELRSYKQQCLHLTNYCNDSSMQNAFSNIGGNIDG